MNSGIFSHVPYFTNDAVVLGILMCVLGGVFYTSTLESSAWKKFYTYFPTLLVAYFVPALLAWPLGLIASHWYGEGLVELITQYGLEIPGGLSFDSITELLYDGGVPKEEYEALQEHSQLYFVASRYLLPAALILLCLGIDFKGVINLGPKALIMFFSATIGIIIGGPIALLAASYLLPDVIGASADELWRGLSTIAGSWIGGGANQAAMKEIFEVNDNLFGTMIVVDIVVANIWMGFLLYGANITDRIDKWLDADSSAIEDLKQRVADYQKKMEKIPDTQSLTILAAVAFGSVALSHWGADVITPWLGQYKETLDALRLNSLLSGFFWMVVIATTIGLILSFTKARKLEGVGASKWGSIFIWILVATIGMKMNLGEVFNNLGLFAIGIIWMLVHVIILIIVAKIIKAPFFFVAVGSQANIGGAASAPVVASAFSPSLAPVGVLMAVLGYALGTYGAIICAQLMRIISS